MPENYSNEIIFGNSSIAHKVFISNLNGTSANEVFLMSFVVPVSSLFWSVLPSFLTSHIESFTRGAAQAVFINLTLLLAFTAWSDYLPILLWTLGGVVLATSVVTVVTLKSSLASERENKTKHVWNESDHKKMKSIFDAAISLTGQQIAFLTDYRGHMLLATAISILSVDFQIFPRRFAKTETYGWSIMDAGVGCFVAVHGICSPFTKKVNITRCSIMWKSLKSSFALLTCGFVRLIAVKAINYNEHVSEYGVHWNFFFTLAVTKILGSIALTTVNFLPSGVLAIACALLHQYLLSFHGVTEFILNDKRENFLEENKEGICSILGFLVIYFFGVEIGKVLQKPRNTLREWVWMLAFLIVTGTAGWIAMYALHYSIQPVSRRMANVAYGIWVIALTSLQLAIHLVEQLLTVLFHQMLTWKVQGGTITSLENSSKLTAMKSCLHWEAINQNGLAYFLLANLLTGFVNICMDTVKASTAVSLFILTAYILVLTATVLILMKFSIRIKCW